MLVLNYYACMKKTVLLQVRVPEKIVKELDRLIELGVFKSRSEAIAESLRKYY